MSAEYAERIEEKTPVDGGNFDAACEELVEVLFEKWMSERKTLSGSQNNHG
jgi:hypothetical protein